MAVDPDLVAVCPCCGWSPSFSAYYNPLFASKVGNQCHRSAVCEFRKAKMRPLTDYEKALVLLCGVDALTELAPSWTR